MTDKADMTVAEIKAALADIAKAMTEKGVKRPETSLDIRPNDTVRIYLTSLDIFFEGRSSKFIYRDTARECIDATNDYVANMPDPKLAVMQTYLGKLADAVDYGHENGIAAEYVDPVRITQKALSDNLLTAPKVTA